MAYVKNPIIPGFNPDPSILRVGKDYYIATSTFEWFPGVQIHHSVDLAHWELIYHPLNRISQLNMKGNPDSCGIWAPCLSYDKGVYYLIYTDVKSHIGIFKDTHNYLVTAEDIRGPWSEPVYLNSSGFDPSLFHEEEGRKWLVNMIWDYRSWKNSFGGIVLQEYDADKKQLIGEPKLIFQGTPLGLTEGPHLYQRNGYYYLLTAEGGTGYQHAVTLARSRNIYGPYEICPWNPILTAHQYPDRELQKAGHASLVEGDQGKWYLAHLCGRPVGEERLCILGRETCLEEVVWVDDWLRLVSGGNAPSDFVELPVTTPKALKLMESGQKLFAQDKVKDIITNPPRYIKEDFGKETWNINLQTLRLPLGERASLTDRVGHLRLYGKESLSSLHEQSLLACRQQDFHLEVTVKLEFTPDNFQQMAGLVYYYDTISHYYLYISRDEYEGRVLSILNNVLGKHTQPVGVGVNLPQEGPVWLRLTTRKETVQFTYSLNGIDYKDIGNKLDATVLSDDYYMKIHQSRFTGAFIGICSQDLSGQGSYADFDFFEYKALQSDN